MSRSCCWIVVPLFRDLPSFLRLREEIQQCWACSEFVDSHEVRFLIIDDSAGSDEAFRGLELGTTEVVVPPFNLGHQRALVFGLRLLAPRLHDSDIIITMDGDGEDQPRDVVRLASALAQSPENTVVLARREQRTESMKFKVLYESFRWFFRILTGVSIRTGNFAAQWGSFVVKTIFHPSFDLCYSTTLLALQRPTNFVPCARGVRFEGSSKMNFHRLVAHGVRMLLPFAERIAVRMLVISGCLLGVGTLSGFSLVVLELFGGVDAMPIAFVPLIALLAGVVTFSGFLAIFAGFAQSSAIALKGLDGTDYGSSAFADEE